MNVAQKLHSLGQRLWLDNISRDLLDNGRLQHYIQHFSISGLTSNPTIFDTAIGAGHAYDSAILQKVKAGKSGEGLFIELALEDLRRAADLFRPLFTCSQKQHGWVSIEVSPLLAGDTEGSIEAAHRIYQQADLRNLFVKIPGTPAGIPAIEALIFAGIPINVTLLFSCEQYHAAAEAYMRGIERRIEAGLNPDVASVASLFVSRWDVAVNANVPESLHNQLGIAICGRSYRVWQSMLETPRWHRLAEQGARPQRLLWASTGTKDPAAPPTLYIEALIAPDTINTVPEKTLLAFVDQGKAEMAVMDGADCEVTLSRFAHNGTDIAALALQLQQEGTQAFVKSWQQLLQRIATKGTALSGKVAV